MLLFSYRRSRHHRHLIVTKCRAPHWFTNEFNTNNWTQAQLHAVGRIRVPIWAYIVRVRCNTLDLFCQCFYPPYVSMEGYIGCCFFVCPVTDISATVTPIGVKFCIMVHIGPEQVFSPLRRYPQIRKFGPKCWQFHPIWLRISRKW